MFPERAAEAAHQLQAEHHALENHRALGHQLRELLDAILRLGQGSDGGIEALVELLLTAGGLFVHLGLVQAGDAEDILGDGRHRLLDPRLTLHPHQNEHRQKEGEEEHTISRGGHEKSFGEKFLLYRGFTEVREYLWISYALADAEGNGLQPSPLVKKLRELFPKAAFLSIPLETVRRDDDLLLAAPRPALSGLANALRGEREHQEMQPCWRDVYNWAMRQKEWQRPLRLALSGLFAHAGDGRIPKELAEQIFAKGTVLRGSVTQFEKFRQCPFAHFAAYGLKLQERREYQFRSMDLGQLLHAVLKEYGSIVKRDYANRWQDVPEEKRAELCEELVNTLAPRLQTPVSLGGRLGLPASLFRGGIRPFRRRSPPEATAARRWLRALVQRPD